jgi:plasmid stability protein
MPVNLSIKAVPDALAERLRRRAERNHRSLQGELMAIIERAAAEGAEAPAPVLERLSLHRRGSRPAEQIAAEHLARHPAPFTHVPSAVDMIREDRDQR